MFLYQPPLLLRMPSCGAMRGINMVTVYDVPAEQLILKTAQKLKENPNIVPPEWAEFPLSGPSM